MCLRRRRRRRRRRRLHHSRPPSASVVPSSLHVPIHLDPRSAHTLAQCNARRTTRIDVVQSRTQFGERVFLTLRQLPTLVSRGNINKTRSEFV